MEPTSKSNSSLHFAIIAISMAVVGVFAIPEFGIHWDELYLVQNAEKNIEWALSFLYGGRSKAEIFIGNVDEHGPAIQMLILGFQKLFGFEDAVSKLVFNHAMGYVFCVFGGITTFRLLKLVGLSNALAYLGVVLIAFHPRIIGHSFFNSKDTVLMYLFILGVYQMLVFIKERTTVAMVLFSLISAIIIDIRFVGLILPIMLVLYLFYEAAVIKGFKFNKFIFQVAFLGLFTLAGIVLFWPFLWDNPMIIVDKLKALSTAKQPNPTFFEGAFFASDQLTWYYLPKMIGVTTPVLMQLVILMGISYPLIKRIKTEENSRQTQLVFVSVFIVGATLASVIISKPVIYNGWRHFQFLWPFLIFPGILVIDSFLNRFKSIWSYSVATIAVVSLIGLSYTQFPYGHAYFNASVTNADLKYEVDYWGLSFKQGSDWLSDNSEGTIKVYYSDFPGYMNSTVFSIYNIEATNNLQEADYFMTNYCYFASFDKPLWRDKRIKGQFPFNRDLVHEISNSRGKILGIYKLK